MFSRDDRARITEPAEHGSSSQGRLTREQVVDRIVRINPTATQQFLEQFGQHHLNKYLDHLVSASEPRGRGAVWARPCDSPSIMCRDSKT